MKLGRIFSVSNNAYRTKYGPELCAQHSASHCATEIVIDMACVDHSVQLYIFCAYAGMLFPVAEK